LNIKEVIKDTYAFFITCEILIDKKQPTKILSRLRVAEEFFPLSLCNGRPLKRWNAVTAARSAAAGVQASHNGSDKLSVWLA